MLQSLGRSSGTYYNKVPSQRPHTALVLERNEGGIIVARPLPSEDVKFLLPYLVALLINRGDNAATRNRLSLTIIENELYTPLRIVLLSYPNSYHLLHTLSP